MPLVSRKGILAIAAVLDIAIHAKGRPVSAKALAGRHQLPPRHLEPVLQALVHDGILKGIRGPRGGYELARPQHSISAEDILRAASLTDDDGHTPTDGSRLVDAVVKPELREAERVFSAALASINLEHMIQQAQSLNQS